jgi:hypothetical protein
MFTNPIKTIRTSVVLGTITAVLFVSPSKLSAQSSPLTVQPSTGRVGIGGVTQPSESLEVNGTVKATSFKGDGSQLTNLPVSGGGTDVQIFATPGTHTWTKPANAKLVYVSLIGGGQGGGSGRRRWQQQSSRSGCGRSQRVHKWQLDHRIESQRDGNGHGWRWPVQVARRLPLTRATATTERTVGRAVLVPRSRQPGVPT